MRVNGEEGQKIAIEAIMSTPYTDTRILVGPCDAKACVFFQRTSEGRVYIFIESSLFLGRHMFRIHLHAILFFEFADESGIPQLTGDPKVLATTH